MPHTAAPYSVIVSVLPTELVIDANLLSDHLRLNNQLEAHLVKLYIEAATGALEADLGISILTQTLVLRLDRFPGGSEIRLPRGTVGRDVASIQSVTSVQYLDDDGATQTFAATDYVVDTFRKPQARIVLAESAVWPITDQQPNSVIITYIAGRANRTQIPAEIKNAILLAASDLHNNRERSAEQAIHDLPMYERLVANYQTYEELGF